MTRTANGQKAAASTPEEHYAYGKVYFDQKEFEHALHEFQLALDASPDSIAVLISLGRCHLARKEYEDAIRCFEHVIRTAPNFADAHYYLGQAFLEQQKRDRAINEFKEALNINSRYKAARAALSHLLKAVAKQPAPKESDFEKDAEEEDNISRQANIHFHLGDALLQKNLLQEASNEFKEAVRMRPNYPDIRNKLGEIYMRRALYNLAEEEFKLALKINPRYLTAAINLAECYRMHSEQMLETAGEMFERANEIAPGNDQARRGIEKIKRLKDMHFS